MPAGPAELCRFPAQNAWILLRTYTTVINKGRQLKLLNLTKKIRELLVITKLLTVFQVYENEQVAAASFA
jgi:anti-sigma B factor antagonist